VLLRLEALAELAITNLAQAVIPVTVEVEEVLLVAPEVAQVHNQTLMVIQLLLEFPKVAQVLLSMALLMARAVMVARQIQTHPEMMVWLVLCTFHGREVKN
jgi:hypothetical protein